MQLKDVFQKLDKNQKVKIILKSTNGCLYRGMIKNIYRSKNKKGLLDIVKYDTIAEMTSENNMIHFYMNFGR